MTNTYLLKISINSFIFFLAYYCWMNIYLIINRHNSNLYLKEKNQTYRFDETPFPGVLYTKLIPVDENCDDSNGYIEKKAYNWQGIQRGVYIGALNSNMSCDFTICNEEKHQFQGYKRNCWKSSDNRFCCQYYAWRNSKNAVCRDNQKNCFCNEIFDLFTSYRNDDPIYGNASLYREYYEIPAIEPILMNKFKDKKICEKLVTDYTLFDSKCEQGIYCYNYICIRNFDKCPDYSDFSIKESRAIYKIITSINTQPCQFFDYTSNVEFSEKNHKLSYKNYTDLNKGCPLLNNSYYDEFLFNNKITLKDFYNNYGILNTIDNYDSNYIRKDNYKYSNYLNDDVYISGLSHPALIDSVNCNKTLLYLNNYINLANSLVKSDNIVLLIFDIIMLFVICLFPIILFFQLKDNNMSKILKILVYTLIIMIVFFIYNLVIYLIYVNNDLANLNYDNMKNCFTNSDNLFIYLDEIQIGILNYEDLFYNTNIKILIQNSVSIFICLISMIIFKIFSKVI